MQTVIIKDEKDIKGNSKVFDIDAGVELLLNFNRKTVMFEKDFKKLTKKQEGKDPEYQKKLVISFVKDHLFNIFKNEFLDKFYSNKEYLKLDPVILNTYIFGIFVVGHSKKFEENMIKTFAQIIKEMTDRMHT
jgi:hypothetical protein